MCLFWRCRTDADDRLYMSWRDVDANAIKRIRLIAQSVDAVRLYRGIVDEKNEFSRCARGTFHQRS